MYTAFFSQTKTHQEDSCEAACNTKFGHGTPGSLGAGLGQVAVVGTEAGGPKGTLPSLLLILLILWKTHMKKLLLLFNIAQIFKILSKIGQSSQTQKY